MKVDYGTLHHLVPVFRSKVERLTARGSNTASGEDLGKTGRLNATLLIVNNVLGAGFLDLPQAFDQAGGVTMAISVQMILLPFIISSLGILAYSSDVHSATTVQQLMYLTWGKRARTVTSIFIAIYTFGTCITCVIVIGDQFDRVFASLIGPTFCTWWYLDRKFTMTVCVTLVLPFCYSKRIDFLKHVSGIGVVAVMYIVLVIVSRYYWYPEYVMAGPIKTSPEIWTDVFAVIPVFCVCYQCHLGVVPIYQCMKNRNLTNALESVGLAMFMCTLIFSTTGAFGYLTFGSTVKSDLLELYDAQDPSVIIAIVAMAINCSTSYPVSAFCGREAVVSLLLEVRPTFKITRITIVSIWFLLSLLLAILLPNIGTVIRVVGSLAALSIFIVPGFCLLHVWHLCQNPFVFCAAAVYLIVGTFIFGVILTQGLLFLLDPSVPPETQLCKII